MTDGLRATIQQSALESLADYLRERFNREIPEEGDLKTQVFPRWVEPDTALPARAVSIIMRGPRKREPVQGRQKIVNQIPDPENTALQIYTFEVQVVQQPIQLDVWGEADEDRDDIIDRLDEYLHAGQKETLGDTTSLGVGAFSGRDLTRDGVLLAMPEPWTTPDRTAFADFTFDDDYAFDAAGSVNEESYRATLMGEAGVSLTVVTKEVPLTEVGLLLSISERALGALPPELYTITDDTFSHTP